MEKNKTKKSETNVRRKEKRMKKENKKEMKQKKTKKKRWRTVRSPLVDLDPTTTLRGIVVSYT